ncbi:MAG TPA: sigma factor [Armatimonadota bacterium]|nr:sigma factor [Armatimonadota bacterium]
MTKTNSTQRSGEQRQRQKRSPFVSRIEHLIDWAEPTVLKTCRDVWRETHPRGMELADLHQEGRIAVFEAAEAITAARRPRAMVATVVRRQAYDAIRDLSGRERRGAAGHAKHAAAG